MEWRCTECGRTHDEPPEICVCGSANLEPRDDGGAGRFSLLELRKRLLEPADADRSLVRDEPYVTVAFRILLVLAVGVSVLLVAAWLLV